MHCGDMGFLRDYVDGSENSLLLGCDAAAAVFMIFASMHA